MAQGYTYAICVSNRGYSAALEVRKVYRILPDAAVGSRGLVRVIDESGEDYLYPEKFFVPIRIPEEARRAFAKRSA